MPSVEAKIATLWQCERVRLFRRRGPSPGAPELACGKRLSKARQLAAASGEGWQFPSLGLKSNVFAVPLVGRVESEA